jgi:CDGSH-type Zn-finger protein
MGKQSLIGFSTPYQLAYIFRDVVYGQGVVRDIASKNQPFCDGSHKGSSFSPVQWMAPESKQVWFCTCKQTATQPLCSGAHKGLGAG